MTHGGRGNGVHWRLRDEGTGTLYAIDENDGSARWKYELDGGLVESAPAVANRTVYIGDREHLYALSMSDGSQEWDVTVPARKSSPAVFDGTVYVGGDESNVFAVSAEDGTVHWKTSVGADVKSSPAVASGRVFVTTVDGTLYALSSDDGEEIWRFETDHAWTTEASPVVVGGTVYFASRDGHVYALSTDDGTVEWKFDTGSGIEGSIAIANGVLYVGNTNGDLYALSHDDPDGLFGQGLFTDPLSIGIGTGALGFGIGRLYKLLKRDSGTGIDETDSDEY